MQQCMLRIINLLPLPPAPICLHKGLWRSLVLFLKKIINLFIWLHLVVALRIFLASCEVFQHHAGSGGTATLACGVLVSQPGMEPASSALRDRLLAARPTGHPGHLFFEANKFKTICVHHTFKVWGT